MIYLFGKIKRKRAEALFLNETFSGLPAPQIAHQMSFASGTLCVTDLQ